jgi:hypothetical protein
MILFSLSLSPSHLFEEYTRCARETDRPRAPKRSTSPRKKTTRKLERARVEQTRKNCFFYPPLFFEREHERTIEKLRTHRCEQRGGGGRSDGRLGELLRQVGRLDRLVDRTVLKVRERLMRDGEYYYLNLNAKDPIEINPVERILGQKKKRKKNEIAPLVIQ